MSNRQFNCDNNNFSYGWKSQVEVKEEATRSNAHIVTRWIKLQDKNNQNKAQTPFNNEQIQQLLKVLKNTETNQISIASDSSVAQNEKGKNLNS